jgi:hypothetical protein
MSALMLGVDKIGTSIQKRLPVLMASLVIMLGIFTLAYRAPVTIGAETNVVSGAENLTQQLTAVDQETLPCCQDHAETDE